MIKVEVDSAAIHERSGISSKNRPYTMREQKCYVHVLDRDTGKPAKYPVKAKLTLEDDQDPYVPGFYMLDPACLQVGDYEALEVQRMRLLPLPAPAAGQGK